MKKSPSVRSSSPAGRPSASKSAGIGRLGHGHRDGEVEGDARGAGVLGSQLAAPGAEAGGDVGRQLPDLEEHVRAGEGRVPAQVDLDLGREPAQVEPPVGTRPHERGLRVPHLGRDPLHPRRVAVAEHHCRGVAPERLGRERVDDEDRKTHPSSLHAAHPPAPNPRSTVERVCRAWRCFPLNCWASFPRVALFFRSTVGWVVGLFDDREDVAGADGVARGDPQSP